MNPDESSRALEEDWWQGGRGGRRGEETGGGWKTWNQKMQNGEVILETSSPLCFTGGETEAQEGKWFPSQAAHSCGAEEAIQPLPLT